MTNHKTMMLLVGICTIIIIATTIPMVFADNYGVDLLSTSQSLDQKTISVVIRVIIPDNDFVTAKLINPDGETAHMIWYKVNSDSLTTFTHTFTDIDKLSKRGMYTILVEYDNMYDDQELITLN